MVHWYFIWWCWNIYLVFRRIGLFHSVFTVYFAGYLKSNLPVYTLIAVKISRNAHCRNTKTAKIFVICFLTAISYLSMLIPILYGVREEDKMSPWFFMLQNCNSILNSLVYFGFMLVTRRNCFRTKREHETSSCRPTGTQRRNNIHLTSIHLNNVYKR